MLRRVKHRFLAGLAVLLPPLATLYLLVWAYAQVGNRVRGFLELVGLQVAQTYQPLLPLAGLALLGGLVYLASLMAEGYLGRKFLVLLEGFLLALPVVRDVYKATQQMTHALFGHQEVRFSRAAVIEYPRKGIYTLCFVVQPAERRLPPLPEGYTVVLVPTSPVPASGMVVLVPEREVIPLEIGVEEALKYVVSAGFVLPSPPSSGPKGEHFGGPFP